MAKTLQTYLAEQDASAIASFLDDDWCICAATSASALEELASQRGATAAALPGYGREEAMLVRRNGHAELWVRARRPVYTGPFLAFAREVCGFPIAAVPGRYNVDHLFSKGRVQTPTGLEDDRLPVTTLVRMLLVDAGVNKSFGALMEGDMVGSGNANRPYRRFTYLQLVKALSIDANIHGGGFGGPHLLANIDYVVAELARRGVLEKFRMDGAEMRLQLRTQAETVLHYRRLRA
ncbi:hypothetical protein [Paracraurococcus lichenis]|uniref:HNH endonuclease n=1 Tax=Paracraurococcus lichenis TaxID=3064888 RepID=A0ABT9E4J3_9PROT|nr:hypothetical protein [Paracraurococcus sp. LOR1-02]MDO9711096.1 hypothetical protein [Paracraurococcus sp. LOR1-02]